MTRYRWTTAHTLMHDVINPFHVFRDRRERSRWYHSPVIAKGLRMIMVYTDCDAGEREIFRALIAPDQGDGTEPSRVRGYGDGDSFLMGWSERVGETFRFVPYGEKYLRHADSRKERDKIAAIDQFAANLNAALSQPLRDFGTVFMDTQADDDAGGHGELTPDRVLYQLYLEGRISLEDIERAGSAALRREQEEYDQRQAAEKDREIAERVDAEKVKP